MLYNNYTTQWIKKLCKINFYSYSKVTIINDDDKISVLTSQHNSYKHIKQQIADWRMSTNNKMHFFGFHEI